MNDNRNTETIDYLLENMRDVTKQESNSVNSYIGSISENTGVNFYDFYPKDNKKSSR